MRRRSGGITAIFGLRTPILMQAFFDPNKGENGGTAGYFGVEAASFPAMKPFYRFQKGDAVSYPRCAEAVVIRK